MLFNYTGDILADISTGKERQLIIEAACEIEAASQAKTQGVYVYSAPYIIEEPGLQQSTEQSVKEFDSVISTLAITVVLTGAVLAISVSPFWLILILVVFVAVAAYVNRETLVKACTTLCEAYRERKQKNMVSTIPKIHRELPDREKFIMVLGLGIPAIILLMFVVYWFRIRDSWELDNYSRITERCGAVMTAVRQSNDAAAEKAYMELNSFVGDHAISLDWLANRIDEAHTAFVPVSVRIEQARQAREAQVSWFIVKWNFSVDSLAS